MLEIISEELAEWAFVLFENTQNKFKYNFQKDKSCIFLITFSDYTSNA